jgi:hypothetical protein
MGCSARRSTGPPKRFKVNIATELTGNLTGCKPAINRRASTYSRTEAGNKKTAPVSSVGRAVPANSLIRR